MEARGLPKSPNERIRADPPRRGDLHCGADPEKGFADLSHTVAGRIGIRARQFFICTSGLR